MALTALKPRQELIDLVGTLGGAWHGRTAMCRCPAHEDRTPSLSLRQGERGILVTCFAGCDRADVLRELRRISVTGRHRYIDHPASGTGAAQRLWDEAMSPRDTLAERYLSSRGLLPAADDLRFHPRCPFRPRPWTSFHPALLVAVREDRRLTAVQRVFLDPATATYRRKLMIGRPGQGAWQGGPPRAGELALAEGFETAQAFSLLHDVACWASLGARRLDQIRLPTNLTRLLLAMDDDDEGQRAAQRAELAYARPGLVVERCPPPKGTKDWARALEVKRQAASAAAAETMSAANRV
jgi:hypothetical protein